jgi:DNA-binding transcriptional LysR family regulator
MSADAVASGALVRILPQWEAPPVPVSYVIPARRLLPAKTRLFVAALTEHFRAQEHTRPVTA